MKMTKRLLSMALALLMLMGLIPLSALPVSAGSGGNWDDPMALTLDAIAYSAYQGSQAWFTYTPETSGDYVFESLDEEGMDSLVYVYVNPEELSGYIATNDDGGEGYNFRCELTLTAGTTYYFLVEEIGDKDVRSIPVILKQGSQLDATAMSLDTGYDVDIYEEYAEEWYSFTSETGGYYAFSSYDKDESVDPKAQLYDSRMELVKQNDDHEDSNFFIQYFVAAGETVYLKAFAYSDTTGIYSIKVEQMPAPTGLHFEEGDTYTTIVGDLLYLNPVFTPADAYHEDITWKSDDESVLKLVEDAEGFDAKAAGTATVTATSDSGLTATCEVTVKEVSVLALDAEQSFSLVKQTDKTSFDFTPSETGDYSFTIRAMDGKYPNLNCDIYNKTDGYYEDIYANPQEDHLTIQTHLTAGITYRARLRKFESATANTFSICVSKIPETTGITIHSNYEGSGFPGQRFELWHRMVPTDAWAEFVSYTSSDPDVVEIVDGNYFEMVGVGTATITATSDSGFTDTLQVTVSDYPTLTLNQATTIAVPHGESYWLKFVPEQSGYYEFVSSNNDGDPYGVLYDADRNGVSSNDDGANNNNNFLMQAYLHADSVYFLEVYGYQGSTLTCDVTVTKPPKATKITIDGASTYTGYQGGYKYFETTLTPANAVREEIKWTSSNPNVVKVMRTYSDGAVAVWFKGAGKATLTAQTATTKLKDSVAITVTGAVAASLNTVKTGTITKARKNYSFKYTPSTAGTYTVRVNSKRDTYFDVVNTSGSGLSYTYVNGVKAYYLQAKKTYYFSVEMDDEASGEFTFLIQKAKALTGITLSATTLTGHVGQRLNLPRVLPIPSMAPFGSVNWTVANEQVACMDDEYEELLLVGAGTTKLTATVGDKTATATITVIETAAIDYTVGDEVTIEYEKPGMEKYYRIQPSQTGEYVIASYGDTQADPLATLYDSDWIQIDRNDDGSTGYHFSMQTALEAGETYYLKIRLYDESTFAPFNWKMMKAQQATAVEIVGGDKKGYVGHGMELDVVFLPDGSAAAEEYEFSCEDNDVLYVSEEGYVECRQPGTATVTVTTESGLTDSITITVEEYPTMTLGQAYPLQFNENNNLYMSFTPSTDGVYSFYTDGVANFIEYEITGLNEYPDQTAYFDGFYMVQAKLTAGETYILRMYKYTDEELPESTISVVKTQQIGVPVIKMNSTTKIQGHTDYLRLTNLDPTAALGEVLGWTTSDPKIATVDRRGYVRYIRAGKVTFTAQTAYGDAKATVTVKATTAMTQGKEYVVTNSKTEVTHKFAPKKDGYYTFYVYGASDSVGSDLFDPQGNYLESEMSGTDVSHKHVAYLVTGQTYYLSTGPRRGGDDFSGISYKVKVGSGAAPKAVKGAFDMMTDATDAFVPTGEKAVVRIQARGEGLTYKWYFANKGKYTYAASSITKDTYSVTMDSSRNGRKLYCVVTDKYGNKMTSRIVTIGIKKPLKITTQLSNGVAKDGSSVKVALAASGDGLTYTWYYKDAGATDFAVTNSFKSTSYTTTMNAARANRQVFCVVSDKYGNAVKTKTVTLYMGTPIKIITQPKSVKVKNGTTAKATVKAVGDGLTYTWYIKNPGAKTYSKSSITKSTYSVKMTTKISGRLVYCVVKDKYGKSVKSSTVSLKKK